MMFTSITHTHIFVVRLFFVLLFLLPAYCFTFGENSFCVFLCRGLFSSSSSVRGELTAVCTATNNFYFKAIIIFLHSICQRKKNSKWKAMINLCSTAIVNWPPLQCHFQTIRRSPIYFYSACTNLGFGNIRRRRMKIAYFFLPAKAILFPSGLCFRKSHREKFSRRWDRRNRCTRVDWLWRFSLLWKYTCTRFFLFSLFLFTFAETFHFFVSVQCSTQHAHKHTL